MRSSKSTVDSMPTMRLTAAADALATLDAAQLHTTACDVERLASSD